MTPIAQILNLPREQRLELLVILGQWILVKDLDKTITFSAIAHQWGCTHHADLQIDDPVGMVKAIAQSI